VEYTVCFSSDYIYDDIVDKENIDYLKWFIDKYGVYANLDKLFIKKLFDIKLFLEQIKPELNP